MTLLIEVDLGTSVPPYEQIRLQVTAHLAAGRLRAGDRLPTIRALASDLGVASGTVARAYRELEAAGVVVTRRRSGTTVAQGAGPTDRVVQEAADRFVAVARVVGLSAEEALAVVRGALLAHPAGDETRQVRSGGTPGPAGGREA